jgi:2'-hydroxyisoflavone reductase
LKLLLLGGTAFLGRHLVDAAQARGHEVTLFNRGQRNPDLYPELEKLRGDRENDLTALQGRRFDAVIDTCGYVPRVVRASAELLADAVDHYTFISTISVFADVSKPGVDESGAVWPHRWSLRPNRPLHVLAAPRCPGRRSAGPWSP